VWWVQAEVLIGALVLYRLTGDERYADLYLQTLDWIGSKHVDWSGGDWHAFVHPNGTIDGDKAGLWKSPYHNGRAMLMCLELLSPGEPPQS
jgi:mannobiose 2-epimerase